MGWILSEKEIVSVSAADTRHRYEYFVHRVCETKAVWTLYNEGWASVADENDIQLILLWPHQAFAAAFANGLWADFAPRKIELTDFLTTWLPGMRGRNMQPAVFPVPAGSSAIVSPDDLEADLRHELDAVYGIEDV